MIRLVFLRWLPFAGLASALCLLIYVSAQQTGRQMANDPQIQIARETRTALGGGRPINPGSSGGLHRGRTFAL